MVTTTIHTQHNDHDDQHGDDDLAAVFPHTPDAHLTRYVYFDEDGLHVGTLRDYAKVWEESQYCDFYLSSEIRTWYGSYVVKVSYVGTDDNDYLHYRLTANDETVYAVIDGRA
jgi:hypothetical protein